MEGDGAIDWTNFNIHLQDLDICQETVDILKKKGWTNLGEIILGDDEKFVHWLDKDQFVQLITTISRIRCGRYWHLENYSHATADMVDSLRNRSNVGMMDCKNALEKCSGDEDLAYEYLRWRGTGKFDRWCKEVGIEQ